MDKRTLGCICDHGTTECKDIVSLCDAHRGYCGVYVCNNGLQEFSGLPRKSDDFLAMTDNRNITKPMRNEQNGLVVMFSSAKHHKAQETKPETDRNQIQNKLWQKQSNRNISTCVAQREVA